MKRITSSEQCFKINQKKLPSCDISIIKLLLYGDDSLDLVTNTLLISFDQVKDFMVHFYRVIIYTVNNSPLKLYIKNYFLFTLAEVFISAVFVPSRTFPQVNTCF